MEYPYAEFLWTHFREKSEPWVNRKENTKAVVVLEGTARWQFFPVLQNFRHFLGDDWNLYVFHTDYNAGWLDHRLADWNVARFKIENAKVTLDVYNSLYKNPAFWNVFQEEWVLAIQADCLCCKPLADEWFQYDYVGAPCAVDTLQGGMSLRKRAKMQEALRRFNGILADGTEDIFFTKALRMMNCRLPDGFDAARFCVESYYYELPFAVHGTDKGYHPITVAEKIVSQIRL